MMSRSTLYFILCLLLSTQAFAQDLALEGFSKRFTLVKNAESKVVAIKLNKAITRFTIRPFIDQIKQDLLSEQQSFMALNDSEKEAEIDNMIYEMGLDPYMKSADGSKEIMRMKESIMNVKSIPVDGAFAELNQVDFWKEFESKINEAFMFIDPTILTNHDDARFFYKRQVTYKVVNWALEQARKRFSNVPVLNIASFIIVRVHDMMMEQRLFHHNMLLHYFETIPESKIGMTKEEIDRAVSSIYESRIDMTNVFESNRAAKDWLNYGMDKFYMQVRVGRERVRTWESGTTFQGVKRLNFAFARATEEGADKIFHLHVNAHKFSQRPAMAYDFSRPNIVKRNRSLITIAGVALGFIRMPGWFKGQVEGFMNSLYVEQVRMEGALVGYFESTGDADMIRRIYAQRANFYIVE